MSPTDDVRDADWLLIDTLNPHAEPSVVADGGRTKSWTSLLRATSSVGARAGKAVRDLVTDTTESGMGGESTLGVVDANTLTAHAIPVLAATGTVHGVQLWVGRGEPTPARVVGAWHWSMAEELAYFGAGTETALFGNRTVTDTGARSSPDVFSQVVRFDDRVGYLQFIENGGTGSHWQGVLDIEGLDGVTRRVQMVVTKFPGQDHLLRALLHDISDASPPAPLVDNAALRLLAASRGRGAGSIDLNTSVVYEWFSAPEAPLSEWMIDRPDMSSADREAMRSACARVRGGSESELVTVQVRFGNGRWIHTRIEISSLQDTDSPQGLIQVMAIDA